MATKKPALVKTDIVGTNETQLDVQRALFKKYGQERWDIIKLIKDIAPLTTVNNHLEDTIVYLCYQVVERDKPFQDTLERLYELEPCTCDEHDDDD
tara:strand:+ start:1153 stop:1440 length:288 start_codon:yes stop_codon:yes gene_type:complete